MKNASFRTSEFVSEGHPDKFCDQVSDYLLDSYLEMCGTNMEARKSVRTAFECLAKDNHLIISGEVKLPLIEMYSMNVEQKAREVWNKVGYSHNGVLTVTNNIKSQSSEIAMGTDDHGAGDQGIMVGFATNETSAMLPKEYVISRDLCMELRNSRLDNTLPWLRSDCKTQVTLNGNSTPKSIVIAAQHTEGMQLEDMRMPIMQNVIMPVLDKYNMSMPSDDKIIINGTGLFSIGGTIGDAGVVGRKIVVDAYGPNVPVGGGAYSGKDFTKVDRSAAYMARHIAKDIVTNNVKGANSCTVKLAYCIGQHEPEMVYAMTDSGVNVSEYVMEKFGKDLSPIGIIERFRMFDPQGWSYFDTASYGHYGRSQFPWEAVN